MSSRSVVGLPLQYLYGMCAGKNVRPTALVCVRVCVLICANRYGSSAYYDPQSDTALVSPFYPSFFLFFTITILCLCFLSLHPVPALFLVFVFVFAGIIVLTGPEMWHRSLPKRRGNSRPGANAGARRAQQDRQRPQLPAEDGACRDRDHQRCRGGEPIRY